MHAQRREARGIGLLWLPMLACCLPLP